MEQIITKIEARQILDSRGNPTLEAEVRLSNGISGCASVPSGASTGVHEALELRDEDARVYGGLGVSHAVNVIKNEIANALWGLDALDQERVDQTMIELDGTPQKENLGANAILAVSLAVARAAASALQLPLYRYLGGCCPTQIPVPFMNVLNGGLHADTPLDIQEFMICPIGFDSFADALRAGVETDHVLKQILHARGFVTNVGDEGGFAPAIDRSEQAFALLMDAIVKAGYKPGEQIGLAIDVASSRLYDASTKKYRLDGAWRTTDELVSRYESWRDAYPLISIEDGCAEDDWESWRVLTERLGSRCQLIGDDLFVTSTKRLKKGLERGVGNSILIKPNQVGTLSETFAAIRLAQSHGYRAVLSHRSGDTTDTFIADLAVASHASQIKSGAPCRAERTAKYNRLLKIEDELGAAATYGL